MKIVYLMNGYEYSLVFLTERSDLLRGESSSCMEWIALRLGRNDIGAKRRRSGVSRLVFLERCMIGSYPSSTYLKSPMWHRMDVCSESEVIVPEFSVYNRRLGKQCFCRNVPMFNVSDMTQSQSFLSLGDGVTRESAVFGCQRNTTSRTVAYEGHRSTTDQERDTWYPGYASYN